MAMLVSISGVNCSSNGGEDKNDPSFVKSMRQLSRTADAGAFFIKLGENWNQEYGHAELNSSSLKVIKLASGKFILTINSKFDFSHYDIASEKEKGFAVEDIYTIAIICLNKLYLVEKIEANLYENNGSETIFKNSIDYDFEFYPSTSFVGEINKNAENNLKDTILKRIIKSKLSMRVKIPLEEGVSNVDTLH